MARICDQQQKKKTANNKQWYVFLLSLSNKEEPQAKMSLDSFPFCIFFPFLFVSANFIVAAVYYVDRTDREMTLSTQINT